MENIEKLQILLPIDQYPKLVDIFTRENLTRAFRKASKNRGKKKDVIAFKENLASNIGMLEKIFQDGNYPQVLYHSFEITEPKKREIWATEFAMRVIQHCFCDFFLTDYFENVFVDRNCACRKGKGVAYAQHILEEDLKIYYLVYKDNDGWFLKGDIRKYFPSINHKDIQQLLTQILPECEIRDFLYYIIDSFQHNGLPLGNQTSQLLALFCLDFVDKLAVEKYKLQYVRYMDDFIAIADSKETLVSLLRETEAYLDCSCHLELNEKTQIHKLKNSIGFLGWNYHLTKEGHVYKTRKKSAKRNSKHHLNEAKYLLQTGQIDAKNYLNRLSSLFDSVKDGSTWHFRRSLSTRLHLD